MKLTKLSTVLLFSAGLVACGGEDGEDGQNAVVDQSLNLTILHMNDHHSHLAAKTFDYDVSALNLSTKDATGAAVKEVEVSYGGFPKMVSLFNRLSQQSDNVLKLHAGDAMTGTLYHSLFKGQADAEMMNQICFDAFALGNHEFDEGDSGLANFLNLLNSSACNTPVLAANVVPGDSSAIKNGYIQPYTVIQRSSQKIGVIGIDIAGKTKDSSRPDQNTEFLDETTTAQKYIDELTQSGINKIILLTHYGYDNDLALAKNLTGVDVIIGGDSHTLLGDSTFTALGFNPVAAYPAQTTDKAGNTVCVAQAWEYAQIMGKLDIQFNSNGVVESCSGVPYLPISNQFVYEYADDDERLLQGNDLSLVLSRLTAEDEVVQVQEDATTKSLLTVFDQDVDVLKQTVIGTNADNLCLSRVPGDNRSQAPCVSGDTYERGSDISNVVAKAFLTGAPQADMAIQNGGGVRIQLNAGDVTIADAFTLLPFSNTLVVLEMTGQQVIDVLEDALANFVDNDGSNGSYPYAAGLRYNVDLSKAKGSRITAVQVNPQVSGSWTAIDPAAVYKVVTNDFIASGQDGYTTFETPYKAGKFEDTFTEYAQGFINYVERLTEQGKQLGKLPVEEYSTQLFIDANGCNHTSGAGCI
ncbi:MAG: 5'-nucleotidase C-terminal domain-containing protein [Saccharospirillaceae bacterium]|nr:5'-nucleotidase C-terminal domain-containing protein [Saccharospirillaceae bacterium]MCD8532550.1 5'-nucleotidase C-terminal domain-containing protein [Saccharospirillaceae bacterium]